MECLMSASGKEGRVGGVGNAMMLWSRSAGEVLHAYASLSLSFSLAELEQLLPPSSSEPWSALSTSFGWTGEPSLW
jgi:hypothetical protein